MTMMDIRLATRL